MSTRNARNQEDSWLENELARQFRPVRAPESLWRQIHEQRRPLRSRPMYGPRWLSIAAASLAGCAALAMLFASEQHPTASDLQRLSEIELRRLVTGSGAMDFSSHNAGDIKAWVMKQSGIDIRIPVRTGTDGKEVKLFGARLIYVNGFPVTAIPYEVNGQIAALLVTTKRKRPGQTDEEGHIMQKIKVAGDTRFVSWEMGKEAYTIAFAGVGESQRECLLCHVKPQPAGKRM